MLAYKKWSIDLRSHLRRSQRRKNDKQADFPVLFTNAKAPPGIAKRSLDDHSGEPRAALLVRSSRKFPKLPREGPFQLLISAIDPATLRPEKTSESGASSSACGTSRRNDDPVTIVKIARDGVVTSDLRPPTLPAEGGSVYRPQGPLRRAGRRRHGDIVCASGIDRRA